MSLKGLRAHPVAQSLTDRALVIASHPGKEEVSANRRRFIQSTGASLATALAAPKLDAEPGSRATTSPQPSLIRQENQREGARDWQLTRIHIDSQSGYRSPHIEGYCSRQSVQVGDRLDIMVSTRPAARFQIEIFRTGYYGARGARLMSVLGPFQGREQPDPPVGENRLRECRWEASATVPIPADWPSGVYLGRLTTLPSTRSQPYWQSYVIFIVRDAGRPTFCSNAATTPGSPTIDGPTDFRSTTTGPVVIGRRRIT